MDFFLNAYYIPSCTFQAVSTWRWCLLDNNVQYLNKNVDVKFGAGGIPC